MVMAAKPLKPGTNIPVEGIYHERKAIKTEPIAQPGVLATQEAIDACVAKWQRILRLQDWRIKVVVKRDRDLANVGAAGAEIYVCPPHRMATIHLLDPIDWPHATAISTLDQERFLVHELLHIFSDPFEPNDRDAREMKDIETMHEALALALVNLDRGL
jgi:hypothetical protein